MSAKYDTKQLASGETAFRWTCSCGARSSVWLTNIRNIEISWTAHARVHHQQERAVA